MTDERGESIAARLKAMGFRAIDPTGKGDFELRDDSDGEGPYISVWASAQECPFPDMVFSPDGKLRAKAKLTKHPAKKGLRDDWKARRLPNELAKHDFDTPPTEAAVSHLAPPDEVAELMAKVDELEAENATLRDALSCGSGPVLPAPDERLADYGVVAGGEMPSAEDQEQIVTGLVDALKTGKSGVEDAMRQAAPDERVKLFSILNSELSRLTNEEALLNKPIPRRGDVQSLLGILAKVGEA